MNRLDDLIALCRGHLVYIQTHNFPDPDAIASAYGLQKLLGLYGVESRLCYDGRIDKLSASKMLDAFQIQMLPYEQLLPHMSEADRIICVDSQKHSGNVTDFIGDEIACIDHHPTFVPIEYQYQDVRITGACATLIAEYFALAEEDGKIIGSILPAAGPHTRHGHRHGPALRAENGHAPVHQGRDGTGHQDVRLPLPPLRQGKAGRPGAEQHGVRGPESLRRGH